MDVIILAILFLHTGIVKMTSQSVITPTSHPATSYIDDESNLKLKNSICECIKYNCGCCQFIEWDVASLNGTLCTNASYLPYDLGISITMTFNNFAIINETISARNPPPVCVGEDIVDFLRIELCLRISDIDIGPDKFHACFEILAKFMNIIKTPEIRLGCVSTKLQKTIKYMKNNTFPYLRLLLHKKIMENSMLPSVIVT